MRGACGIRTKARDIYACKGRMGVHNPHMRSDILEGSPNLYTRGILPRARSDLLRKTKLRLEIVLPPLRITWISK